MECHEIKTRQYDSAGQPIKEWICYCGTTACLKNRIHHYHSVEIEKTITNEEISDILVEMSRPGFEREMCDKCGVPHWKNNHLKPQD